MNISALNRYGRHGHQGPRGGVDKATKRQWVKGTPPPYPPL